MLRTGTQVLGAVVDVQFPANCRSSRTRSPAGSTTARSSWVPRNWERTVRCIAMDSTDGMVRGQEVVDTGGPIVPWAGTLGRILNVIGDPIDERAQSPPSSACRSIAMRRRSSRRPGGNSGHRHQSRRLLTLTEGGKVDCSAVRGGQTVLHSGTDQQHRQGARRRFGVRRRGAHARRQRSLSRDDDAGVIKVDEPQRPRGSKVALMYGG